MMSLRKSLTLLFLCLLIERCGSKRGGIGIGRVGGGSSSRRGMNIGRMGGSSSRGSSASRTASMSHMGGTAGGLFGGGTRTGSQSGHIGRGTSQGGWNTRGSQTGDAGWNTHSGGAWGKSRGSQGSWGHGSRWSQTPRTSTFSKSGIGSFLRSNKFKNAIVGAAAGYLTYQAGKALIRSAVAPMMWNNRPYYWGTDYYPSSRSRSNMCRMPIDHSDPTFGNIYFQDGSTRPHEIVWSCGYNEYCCGYECCPYSDGGWGWGRGGSSSYWPVGIGYVLALPLAVHVL